MEGNTVNLDVVQTNVALGRQNLIVEKPAYLIITIGSSVGSDYSDVITLLPKGEFPVAQTTVLALDTNAYIQDLKKDASENRPAVHTLLLGPRCCNGEGAKGSKEVGQQAYAESASEVEAFVSGIKNLKWVIVISAPSRGGTGPGATLGVCLSLRKLQPKCLLVLLKASEYAFEAGTIQAEQYSGLVDELYTNGITFAQLDQDYLHTNKAMTKLDDGQLLDEFRRMVARYLGDIAKHFTGQHKVDLSDLTGALEGPGNFKIVDATFHVDDDEEKSLANLAGAFQACVNHSLCIVTGRVRFVETQRRGKWPLYLKTALFQLVSAYCEAFDAAKSNDFKAEEVLQALKTDTPRMRSARYRFKDAHILDAPAASAEDSATSTKSGTSPENELRLTLMMTTNVPSPQDRSLLIRNQVVLLEDHHNIPLVSPEPVPQELPAVQREEEPAPLPQYTKGWDTLLQLLSHSLPSVARTTVMEACGYDPAVIPVFDRERFDQSRLFLSTGNPFDDTIRKVAVKDEQGYVRGLFNFRFSNAEFGGEILNLPILNLLILAQGYLPNHAYSPAIFASFTTAITEYYNLHPTQRIPLYWDNRPKFRGGRILVPRDLKAEDLSHPSKGVEYRKLNGDDRQGRIKIGILLTTLFGAEQVDEWREPDEEAKTMTDVLKGRGSAALRSVKTIVPNTNFWKSRSPRPGQLAEPVVPEPPAPPPVQEPSTKFGGEFPRHEDGFSQDPAPGEELISSNGHTHT